MPSVYCPLALTSRSACEALRSRRASAPCAPGSHTCQSQQTLASAASPFFLPPLGGDSTPLRAALSHHLEATRCAASLPLLSFGMPIRRPDLYQLSWLPPGWAVWRHLARGRELRFSEHTATRASVDMLSYHCGQQITAILFTATLNTEGVTQD